MKVDNSKLKAPSEHKVDFPELELRLDDETDSLNYVHRSRAQSPRRSHTDVTVTAATTASATSTASSVKEWKSCCFRVDKRCLHFSSRVVFSAIVLLFAISQIIRDPDSCTNSMMSWYCSLIGLILGSYLNIDISKSKITV